MYARVSAGSRSLGKFNMNVFVSVNNFFKPKILSEQFILSFVSEKRVWSSIGVLIISDYQYFQLKFLLRRIS